MSVKSFLARHVLGALPARPQRALRRAYYARLLRSYPQSRIEGFPVVRTLVGCGDCVVDIGANIGVVTKHLSPLVGDRGIVYSIEPVPLTYDVLTSNVRKLDLRNVTPIHCAVSDAERRVTMEVPLFHHGAENFYRARIMKTPADDSLRHVSIETRTLDSLLGERIGDVSFVKCDVEGHELSVIRGAKELIARSRPAWMIEINGDPDTPGSAAQKTVGLMTEAGYSVHWFDGDTLRQRRPGQRATDYFFLLPEHLAVVRREASSDAWMI